MLPFLARLRSKSSLKAKLSLPVEKELILLELSLEAKIRAHIGPCLANEGDGFLESIVLPLHQERNNQRRRLYEMSLTLEIPAAQWTSMLPLASSRSTSSTNCEKYFEMFSDFISRSG